MLLTANQDEVHVFFEPEGAEHTLRGSDRFTVEISGKKADALEITYGPEGLTVCAWNGAATRVWNKSGVELAV